MRTLVAIDLQWGIMKIGIYCYLNADILTKVFLKYSLSSPLPNISSLSKPLNLIGYHGNRKAKIEKNNNQKSTKKP